MTTDSGQQRIGIFDSGVGGVTVLTQLYRQLPNESILYFGDTARLPYGTRAASEIVHFVREIMAWLVAQDVKMVIMACNTSSALAMEMAQAEFDIPVLGVILPGAQAAAQQGKRIGVIATPATAASNAYRNAILEMDDSCRVWQVSCPAFVPLVEQNRIHDPYTSEVAREYLAPLIQQRIDTLIYGCTHYPLLPTSVTLIDPAVRVVAAAARELEVLGLRNAGEALPTRFCVSGKAQQFADLSVQWLGCTPAVEKISLPTVVRSEAGRKPSPVSLESVE